MRSQRGAQGGYRMSRSPEEYTIGDILRVTEGELAPVACLEGGANECPRASGCLTVGFWEGLYDVISKYLDGTTLADLAAQSGAIEDDYCCYI